MEKMKPVVLWIVWIVLSVVALISKNSVAFWGCLIIANIWLSKINI